jgi:hypothetical protein
MGYNYTLLAERKILTPLKGELALSPWATLTPDGVLTIRKNYSWNGDTFVCDTEWSMDASMCHDALYQLIRCGCLPYKYRKAADELYYTMCVQAGMPLKMAKGRYTGLRALGWIYAKDWRIG